MKIGSPYDQLIIIEYSFWTLCLSEKQLPYVGRCYAWWKDTPLQNGERMPPWDLHQKALQELYHAITPDVMKGLKALGHLTEPYGEHFLLNTCYLANEPDNHHHMHVHFIPRFDYVMEIKGSGIDSVDERWGKNYAQPSDAPAFAPEILENIRKRMADAIG
jgi:diadenosine tetraphosphate (Ap4A) HIT family hydrolase